MKRGIILTSTVALFLVVGTVSFTQAATSASVPGTSEVCDGCTIVVPMEVDSDGGSFSTVDLTLGFDPLIVSPVEVIPAVVVADCSFGWAVIGGGSALDINVSCGSGRTASGPVAYAYFAGAAAAGTSALTWLTADLDAVPVDSVSPGSIDIVAADSKLRMTAVSTSTSSVDLPLFGDLAPGTIGINAEVHWDPVVLAGIDVTLAAGLPGDCFLNSTFPAPGEVLIAVSCITPISGSIELVNISASVLGAPGLVTPLDVVSGQVNEIDACLEDGIFTAVAAALVAVPDKTPLCEDGTPESVPLVVSPADGVLGMDFSLAYDPALVLPLDVGLAPLTVDCTVDWTIPVAGVLEIAIFCVTPLSGSGPVAIVEFQAVGPGPASTPLTWLQHDLNEGAIPSTAQDGQFNIVPEEECVPLVVTFESISATATAQGVLVRWITASEVDTVGFRVLRETLTGREKRLDIVADSIAAVGMGVTGASYELLDDSAAAHRAIHYYLEDIDFLGRVTRHGPIAIDRGVRQAPTRRSGASRAPTR